MTKDIQQPENQEEETEVTVDELTLLKRRATQLGISYSNNIGLETLRERVAKAMEGNKDTEEPVKKSEAPAAETPAGPTRNELRKEAEKLIRIRYTNMNPLKKDVPGEFFTVANSVIGTIRKYVPYGAASENGWHVPNAIYKMMKRRTFTVTATKRDAQGRPYQTKVERKEFAIEVLPPLTKEELEKLAKDQRASGRI
ncbi:hypothetical protein ZC03_020 [Pseudomonas phage ZC03]|uniref:Uncharacterized protein n=2 Tax=Zicotriavirus TaxID=2843161 RepID=A0A1L2C926_9CAUD|nr:hypothetical protein HWA93_gp20 [Pseudomonas phage ZC03]YP_009830591.1 hypothetical protein HWA94_gp20 [Pseudomonas phage ZC08]AMD43407.1 hypothetical protein ZC03_020 [Pseudomonas phage ZC03]AMD43536.1 hypothetical protein ZC08_020 [Pseudomonas phage ZC08]